MLTQSATIHQLQLKSAQKRDLGVYHALAQNQYGEVKTSSTLNEGDPFLDSSRQQSVARDTPNIFVDAENDMDEDIFLDGIDGGDDDKTRHPKHHIHRKGMAPTFVIGLSDMELHPGDVAAVAGKLQAKKRKHRLFEKHGEDDGKFLSDAIVSRMDDDQHSSGSPISPISPHENTSKFWMILIKSLHFLKELLKNKKF